MFCWCWRCLSCQDTEQKTGQVSLSPRRPAVSCSPAQSSADQMVALSGIIIIIIIIIIILLYSYQHYQHPNKTLNIIAN